jgi:hypothetical protein
MSCTSKRKIVASTESTARDDRDSIPCMNSYRTEKKAAIKIQLNKPEFVEVFAPTEFEKHQMEQGNEIET